MHFEQRLQQLRVAYGTLIKRKNIPEPMANGFVDRYRYPVLTAAHVPLTWRYDFNKETNPYLLERIGINAVFNAGAIRLDSRYLLVARVEGSNRKSFFAVAESANGIDGFEFWEHPLNMPEEEDETNIYDMRLVQHEDGWIYGIFCSEKRDPSASDADQAAAIARCAIARTRDLLHWERLANLKTTSAQQRNAVLHPEFVEGMYAFYTRPQDGFIEAGRGGGIGFGLSESIECAKIRTEKVIDGKKYHTISETKNGLGPAPIKTTYGWLHLAHGVRNTAAGLRYVLYLFMTDLQDVTRIIYKPSGYFLAPEGEERTGDVSNVLFSNGWILDDDGRVLIYYGSSDTRMHVASSTLDKLIDYVRFTPPDGFTSAATARAVSALIDSNQELRVGFLHQD